jgi:hypothetical protein
MSLQAQTPMQTKYLYEKYANNIDVKLIVFEVNPDIFSVDGIEGIIDLLTSDNIDRKMTKLALQTSHPNIYNTLIYMYVRKLLGYKLLYKGSVGSYIKGGGYVSSGIINQFPNKEFNEQVIDINIKQLDAFEKLISIFKKKNINVLLIQSPVTTNYYTSILNIMEFDSLMASYGRYYNFNNLLQLDDSLDFTDHNHLNQNGVEKFNQKLIETIIKE